MKNARVSMLDRRFSHKKNNNDVYKKFGMTRLILTSEFKIVDVEKSLEIRFVTSTVRNSLRGFSKSWVKEKLVLNQDYIQQSLKYILYIKYFIECRDFVTFKVMCVVSLKNFKLQFASNYIE